MKKHTLLSLFILLFTISLSAQPAIDWQQTFNGGSNLVDKAIAIVHDNSCNTIVVGQSDSLGQGVNIVTLKYDQDGNLLWQQSIDGPDHLDDIPTGLTVDLNDNIYICGMSQGAATGIDYITMKYTSAGLPATGIWPVRYNNTNANGNGYDAAKSIAVYQTSGDVYVGGESMNHYSGLSGLDAFVIRYNSQGVLLDSVGGISGGDATLSQIGMTNSGKLFVLTYDSQAYFTSYLYTPNLTNAGTSWTSTTGVRYQPSSFAMDAANYKYYATSRASGGIQVVKVDDNNNIPWHKDFRRSTSSLDTAVSVAVDASGNSYTVSSSQIGGFSDVWILKLNSNGDTLWNRTWGSGNGVNDEPIKIVSTSSPSAVVVTVNTRVSGVNAITTLKYDANGTLMSGYPLYLTSPIATATDFTCDQSGNIYGTGFTGALGNEDFLTYKYKVNAYPVTVVNVNGDSLSVSPAASSYQWYKDTTTQRLLAGETNRGIKLYPDYGNGRYYCKVEQYCSTYYTDTLNAMTVGVGESNLSVEPVSISLVGDSRLNVAFNQNMSDVYITIFDVLGRLVVSKYIGRISGGSVFETELPTASGAYILKVVDGNSIFAKSIVNTNP